MNRLLIEIIDDPLLSHALAFKGGTCASMLGFLDRFSVDLDFDLLDRTATHADIQQAFVKICAMLHMSMTHEFATGLFFQVKYETSSPRHRNTIKVSLTDIPVHANTYRVSYLSEIDRLMQCQTVETMFANKLVAMTDRYAKYTTVAGRDLYDIHYFFTRGYAYNEAAIQERTGVSTKVYLQKLAAFINQHVTQTTINEDLNTLLPHDTFQRVRKILIPETIHFLSQP